MKELTHVDSKGRARMVDVGEKPVVRRIAKAEGTIYLSEETVKRVKENRIKKGDVLTVSELAGVMAAKETPKLIPLCHNISLSGISVIAEIVDEGVKISAAVNSRDRTGVEMEALTAVSVSLLTVYDMCKAVDKGMVLGDIRLVEKQKGREGE